MENDSRTRGDGLPLAVLDAMPESLAASESLLLPEARRYTTLRVVLIKPSKYDDEGHVIRFWRGVLPSNTLNVLHGLTVDVAQKRLLGEIEIQVDTFDETTQKVPVKKIVGWARQPATKLIVGLVGVQTNQFPRALDLGREFRAHGLDVLMGGFHTSGTINMLSEDEPDIQTLFRESIVVVSGEVEGVLGPHPGRRAQRPVAAPLLFCPGPQESGGHRGGPPPGHRLHDDAALCAILLRHGGDIPRVPIHL